MEDIKHQGGRLKNVAEGDIGKRSVEIVGEALSLIHIFLFYKGSRENRLSFFYAYEQKGATSYDKTERENPRGAASRD